MLVLPEASAFSDAGWRVGDLTAAPGTIVFRIGLKPGRNAFLVFAALGIDCLAVLASERDFFAGEATSHRLFFGGDLGGEAGRQPGRPVRAGIGGADERGEKSHGEDADIVFHFTFYCVDFGMSQRFAGMHIVARVLAIGYASLGKDSAFFRIWRFSRRARYAPHSTHRCSKDLQVGNGRLARNHTETGMRFH